MDRHDVPGASAEDAAKAHVSDLEAAGSFGVQFISYWFDAEAGGVFCFANAPSRDALMEVHSASHGLVPNEIISVSQDDVFRFLGSVHDPKDASELSSPLRTIMFTDLVGSTEILGRLGETRFMELLTTHDGIVREALYRHRGREVKHTGDGIMASFAGAGDAVRGALAIEDAFARLDATAERLRVRVGLAAGQPVDRNDDIFGEAVVLASRLCNAADPQKILSAASVRDHAGDGFVFVGPIERTLKGFAKPIPVFEVRGAAAPGSDALADQRRRPSWWRRLTRRGGTD
jgi:class 3 adenylate cyclase